MNKKRKCIDLILKDTVVYRKMVIFILYPPAMMFFIPVGILSSDLLRSLLSPVTLVITFLFVLYMIEEDKNQATEGLTATAYTRSDIVSSRYMLIFLISIVQFLLTLVVLFFTLGWNEVLLSIVFLSMLFGVICISVSVQVVLSFMLKPLTFGAVAAVFEVLIVSFCVFMNQWVQMFCGQIICYVICFAIIAISTISIVISKIISDKIYLNKDL